jgi:hypothetical protein
MLTRFSIATAALNSGDTAIDMDSIQDWSSQSARNMFKSVEIGWIQSGVLNCPAASASKTQKWEIEKAADRLFRSCRSRTF